MINPLHLRRQYHEFSLSLRAEEVDRFGLDPIFEEFIHPLTEFFYKQYWRVDVFGLENVPTQGPAVFVGNHSGAFGGYDAVMFKHALQYENTPGRKVRFLIDDFLSLSPFLGSWVTRYGGVLANHENAEDLLSEGSPILVFPEGTKGLGKPYKNRYHLARFGRGGFVKLCLKTKAPLIPVVFIGGEEIHPMIYQETLIAKMLGFPYLPITWTFPWLGPLGLLPLPSKWSIHILPPIDFSAYGPGAEKDRVLVYSISQQVKQQIQETITEKIKERKSIWWG